MSYGVFMPKRIIITIEDENDAEDSDTQCIRCGGSGKFHKLQCPHCGGSGIEP